MPPAGAVRSAGLSKNVGTDLILTPSCQIKLDVVVILRYGIMW